MWYNGDNARSNGLGLGHGVKESGMKILSAMRSLLGWLEHLFGLEETKPGAPTVPLRQPPPISPPPEPSSPSPVSSSLSPVPSEPIDVEKDELPGVDIQSDAFAYLDRVRDKLDKLAADFNEGAINRAQFRSLYAHYQRELQSVEHMIEQAPASDDWKDVMTEGQSLVIRRQHLARAEGYAIFENGSGMPLSTLGQFDVDPALLVPMLSSYRAAAKEMFGAGARSTEMEDGSWLCFVPGEWTTMLAVFTAEPAGKQLAFLDQLHRHFERANQRRL